MDNAQAGMGFVDYAPPITTLTLRRRVWRAIAPTLGGLAFTALAFGAMALTSHIERRVEVKEERAIYQARIADLEAQLAQWEGFDCTNGPAVPLGKREFKLCSRERTTR